QFVIMLASSITGIFAGLPDGQVFALGNARFQINYTPTSVVLTHVADAATQFLISAPNSAVSGTPFDLTVLALDAGGNVDPLYTGTVTFSSSDTDPGVVLPADYTFTSDDAGVHTFTDTGLGETTLITLGDQTVTATAPTNGINGSATVAVPTGGLAPGGGAGSPSLGSVPAAQAGSVSAIRAETTLPGDRAAADQGEAVARAFWKVMREESISSPAAAS